MIKIISRDRFIQQPEITNLISLVKICSTDRFPVDQISLIEKHREKFTTHSISKRSDKKIKRRKIPESTSMFVPLLTLTLSEH